MKKIVLLLLFCAFTTLLWAQERVLLSGPWTFHQEGSTDSYSATVPGCVHTDLLNNRLISDPFEGDKEKTLYWIDSLNWVYETIFDIKSSYRQTNLFFEGLDTYADVFVDDRLVHSNTNMFTPVAIPLSAFQPGKHRLKILFRSALKEMEKYNPADYFILKDEPRAMLRKAQYQFGWDWGPRFVTMGIWKPVYLEYFDEIPQIYDVSLKQKSLDEQSNIAVIDLQFRIMAPRAQHFSVVLKERASGKIYWRESFSAMNSDSLVTAAISFPKPLWWYPNGLGQPHLYTFELGLYFENRLVDTVCKRIGFKNVHLHREKDEQGERFYFVVNGHKVFAKGANWVPAESFLPRLTKDNYYALVAQAAACNFNMLRVWGGGIYEEEAFYEACDEMGIMVWQDFMFACALYPGTVDFLQSVKNEATIQIRRIAQHASLALWCGNNEIDEGWHNWGWKKEFGADTAKVWDNYSRLFHRLLPGLVQLYDPQHDYLSSSPVFGWGREQSMYSGDSHYWGVWWGMQAFDIYNKKIPRFMSEYGFQGFPSLASFARFLPEEKDRYLGSLGLKAHQKHPRGYETIQTYMEREYQLPENLEDYSYVSQLLQAYGMRTAMEAHRRAKPYCMGSLYWQFNDCWPVVSWAGIDYYGDWKALQYFAKKAFAPHLLSIVADGDTTALWLVTDAIVEVRGRLGWSVQTFDGKEIYRKDSLLTIPANSAQKIGAFCSSDFVQGENSVNVLCYAHFDVGGRTVTEAFKYFSLPKYSSYPSAVITITEGQQGALLLKADKLVKNLCVTYNGRQSPFSDNFFDMLPGKIYILQILEKDIIPERLQWKSLNTTLDIRFLNR